MASSPSPTHQTRFGHMPNPTIAPFSTGLDGVNQPNNLLLSYILWGSLSFLAVSVILVRLTEIIWSKLRLVSAMTVSGDQQVYWKYPQLSWTPALKKHLIYAPLNQKRHSRKFTPLSRLGPKSSLSKISFGNPPTRLHTILMLLYLGSNLSYTLLLDWSNENRYAVYAELRGRSGTMAAVNIIPLVLLAGRNNPLIPLLRLRFDTCNLIHRWVGRVVVVEAVVHASVWAVVQVADDGWRSVLDKTLHDRFIGAGVAGWLALVLILLTSLSPVRSLAYDAFLNVHILLALVTFLCALIHCSLSGVDLPQLPWIVAALCLWLAERLARLLRLAYCNWSARGVTTALVEPMAGSESCRVTMYLPRHVAVRPGMHAYIRFAGVRPWENHPFSIAWSEFRSSSGGEDECLPTTEKKEHGRRPDRGLLTASFVIRAHAGFTRQLFDRSRSSMSGKVRMLAAFEGPYAGNYDLDSYGHIVLFAGATGITHQIGFLRHLVRGRARATVATRRALLVWIIRERQALEWVRPWMDEILAMPHCGEVARVKVFVTGTGEDGLLGWAGGDAAARKDRVVAGVEAEDEVVISVEGGRPDVLELLRREVREQVGAMCVTVCGPGGLADDVRAATRDVQDQGQVVDFMEESFSW